MLMSFMHFCTIIYYTLMDMLVVPSVMNIFDADD